jgi:hypothetical protein
MKVSRIWSFGLPVIESIHPFETGNFFSERPKTRQSEGTPKLDGAAEKVRFGVTLT